MNLANLMSSKSAIDGIMKLQRESREKAAQPCTLIGSNGDHRWQYHRGCFTERLYKECNCGARAEMGKD
jgi:hypothetical protein